MRQHIRGLWKPVALQENEQTLVLLLAQVNSNNCCLECVLALTHLHPLKLTVSH